VPVPETLGLCTDEEVNGAPFYVMSFVAGSTIFHREQGAAVAADVRPKMTASLVETLAALHALDPDDVGLGDLSRKENYLARQLKRWKRQIDEGTDRSLPLLHDVHQRLSENIPPQQGVGIVHGDYRLDNCMMASDGKVAAVLDWELCTLGDVLSDLAGMVMYWGDDDGARGRLAIMPTSEPGFGTSEDVVDQYAALSDRDLGDLPWYIAFQHWRLACIMEGVRVRFALGAMGSTEPYDDTETRAGIDYMLDKAREILDR
jgi:aminoglycoside phosphotransferase (APT) family kinase protein